MPDKIVHFLLHYTVVNGEIVPVIGSGVVQDRIDTQGGRRSGLLVRCSDGTARVVYETDLVREA